MTEPNLVGPCARCHDENLKGRCAEAIPKIVERTVVRNRLEEHFASAVSSLKHPHCGIIRRGKVC